MPIKLLYRDEWTSVPPRWTVLLHLPVYNVFIGQTHKGKCYTVVKCINEMLYLQRRHMNSKGCPDIKYNFIIGCDGTVFEGRGWFHTPGLPTKYSSLNKSSLFIALTGQFVAERDTIPSAMQNALNELIQMGIEYKYIDTNYVPLDL